MSQVMVGEKAQVDQDSLEVEEFASQASVKVQLDIDDAPFLIDDDPLPDEETESSVVAFEHPNVDEELDAAKKRKKKLMLIGILGASSLILSLALIWFFFFRTVAPVEVAVQAQPTVVIVPSPEKITGPKEFTIKFEPFIVQQRNTVPPVKFLRIVFSSISTDEKIAKEVQDRSLVLRDAIYYYLRNKTHEYLLNSENVPTVKQDILDVINNYISKGKLEDIFIENYLIK